MKTLIKSLLLLIASTISIHTQAQKISLGDNLADVSNILRDRVRNYYNAQGSQGMETGIELKHYNGEISEIMVWVKNGFLYDLRLTADYTTHYMINDNKLDYISTQYENISTEQLKRGFDISHAERHIGNFYFAEGYRTYKTITLGNKGWATVEEISTSTTRFPTKVAEALQKLGITNRFMDIENNQINQNARYNGKSELSKGSVLNNSFGISVSNHNPNTPSRYFIVKPQTSNEHNAAGKVVVDIVINKAGDIIEAKTNFKSSKVTDTTLFKDCEEAVKKAKLNAVSVAPDMQKAQCTFIFKIY